MANLFAKKPKLAAKVVTSAGKGGNNPANPTKAAANVKTSQGKGGGLKQANGGAAKIAAPAKRGTNALNKAPIIGKTATAKKPKILRNSVTAGDVKRMRAAHQLATPKTAGGGFKKFIGSN